MVGHKLGEFSHTRTFKGHSKAGSVSADKKSTVAPAAAAGPKK
jgi:ribosomal protein S19